MFKALIGFVKEQWKHMNTPREDISPAMERQIRRYMEGNERYQQLEDFGSKKNVREKD